MGRDPGTRPQPVPGPRNQWGAREDLCKGWPGILWLQPEGQACLLAPGVQGRPQKPGGLAWVRTLIVKPERYCDEIHSEPRTCLGAGLGGAGRRQSLLRWRWCGEGPGLYLMGPRLSHS